MLPLLRAIICALVLLTIALSQSARGPDRDAHLVAPLLPGIYN